MDQNLKPEEREVIKLVGFFKKRAEKLIEEQKLPEDYRQLIETSNKLVEQITIHAKNRETIINERSQLQNLIKENAVCPKCSKNDKLKFIGIEKSKQGWKSNKYKCRNCNIEFVWNAPNNPWDMIPYVEHVINQLREKIQVEGDETVRIQSEQGIQQMEANVARLKPIIEASDLDMADLEAREKEMAEVVHKFKKHLQIEKIRLED
ncbi:MAG: hypothetical protein V4608_15055 [Bacteroidota bacterium]